MLRLVQKHSEKWRQEMVTITLILPQSALLNAVIGTALAIAVILLSRFLIGFITG